ncbi:hypothetical protein GX586_08175 [bacterium]|nr:hypothetical protein [bacterium]
MKTLVLNPGVTALEYWYYDAAVDMPLYEGCIDDYRNDDRCMDALTAILMHVSGSRNNAWPAGAIDLVAVRIAYGGAVLRAPALLTGALVSSLAALVPEAPLHLPPAITLLGCLRACLDGVPVAVVADTAFFTGLPERESSYAIDARTAGMPGLRRYGFNGLHHQEACAFAACTMRVNGAGGPCRTISLCLEPHPELAAVIGMQPVMVTGGATPLEGLPGETTCGELDPTIALMLAGEQGWGPERINEMLTRRSGLAGLCGRPATLPAVCAGSSDAMLFARDVMLYRMLMACGAAIAAMGGADALAFSGRYASTGSVIGPLLAERLPASLGVRRFIVEKPLQRIVAERAASCGGRGTDGE